MSAFENTRLEDEITDLRRRLKLACDLAELLDKRFKRVWQASVVSEPELDDLTENMQISHFITTRLRR